MGVNLQDDAYYGWMQLTHDYKDNKAGAIVAVFGPHYTDETYVSPRHQKGKESSPFEFLVLNKEDLAAYVEIILSENETSRTFRTGERIFAYNELMLLTTAQQEYVFEAHKDYYDANRLWNAYFDCSMVPRDYSKRNQNRYFKPLTDENFDPIDGKKYLSHDEIIKRSNLKAPQLFF